jgi:hypothetical protein
MTEGMDDTATTISVRGIQNHSTPIAAPVIIDAVGTRPSDRSRGVSVVVTGGAGAAPTGVVTATMSSTYGLTALHDTAIPRDSGGG